MSEHSVRHARWEHLTTDELYDIVRLRNRVFALEQRVSAEDFDGRDREPDTEHWWSTTGDGSTVGYLRLVRPADAEPHPEGTDAPIRVVGRVATRADHRGRGIAGGLVAAVLDRHGHEPFVLHAQQYVAALYERHGFVRFGAPYDEAGIAHVGMYRPGS
ncbi:GNAT family N-acetyltransferase [Curtobacterium sp. MCSS17_015]|uniref:GNAT family N-acetyltransferase n=1 Tax=Curtobacterium sp. MCSS17_015 TaxID=2175666 RepID=UPI000DA8C83A|nr:GNAT family N-acetyltransferase [Curtobacterium sp. MCSS17_015]WIB26123.1 GNAT family N-acetyltransferase [Curtobacterium sp. MCSS17_015]